ncbi:hypothetical protein GCM10009819_14590 [Agromyces tropicus]|uniref:SHOCT domain-containing protein n=1 Tax=Agromyces tropicus TaxID=555371 RepID=A0ABN2U7Y1_9MICO
MMWDYGVGTWWLWIPGLLFFLLVIAGIVVLVVLLVRSTGSAASGPHHTQPPHAAAGDPARRILEERLARGEVTPEKFRELVATLDESRRQGPVA